MTSNYRSIKPKYAVVDRNGNIIIKFRNKVNATQALSQLKIHKSEDLKVIPLV